MTRRQPALIGSSCAPHDLPLPADVWAKVVQSLALSPQQARIVEALLRGMRDKQIAHEIGLTTPTVRTYLGRIFRRVGVKDRVELILRVFSIAYALGSRGGCSQT